MKTVLRTQKQSLNTTQRVPKILLQHDLCPPVQTAMKRHDGKYRVVLLSPIYHYIYLWWDTLHESIPRPCFVLYVGCLKKLRGTLSGPYDLVAVACSRRKCEPPPPLSKLPSGCLSEHTIHLRTLNPKLLGDLRGLHSS